MALGQQRACLNTLQVILNEHELFIDIPWAVSWMVRASVAYITDTNVMLHAHLR